MDKNVFNYYAQTDIGLKKANNEDAFVVKPIWNDKLLLAVVIDGVGGYDGGEVAAEIAQKEIPATLEASTNGERVDLLAEAVTAANNEIFEHRKIEFPSMSCVLSAIIIDTELNQINLVHVGDTRVYQFHDSELRKLSHDHSLVGYMEETGRLTEIQAMTHPERNIISRDVGSKMHGVDDDDFIESNIFPLLPNSIFLLCSDGLTDLVTSAEIISVLEQSEVSLEQKVHTLVDLANEKGGKDNITVVLVEYNGGNEEPEPMPIVVSDELNKSDDENTETNERSSSDSGKKNLFVKRSILVLVILIVVFGLGVLLGFLLWSKSKENNNIIDKINSNEKLYYEPLPNDSITDTAMSSGLFDYINDSDGIKDSDGGILEMKEEINKLTKIITGKNAEITLLKADKDSLSAKLKAKQEETKKLNEELKSCRGW